MAFAPTYRGFQHLLNAVGFSLFILIVIAVIELIVKYLGFYALFGAFGVCMFAAIFLVGALTEDEG